MSKINYDFKVKPWTKPAEPIVVPMPKRKRITKTMVRDAKQVLGGFIGVSCVLILVAGFTMAGRVVDHDAAYTVAAQDYVKENYIKYPETLEFDRGYATVTDKAVTVTGVSKNGFGVPVRFEIEVLKTELAK